jgi:non-canonical poly(A) RNA polymerase PAPD5/7
MLGVDAKETIALSISGVSRSGPNGSSVKVASSSKRAAESVRSAWKEADVDLESGDERSRASRRDGKRESWKAQEEVGGRYDIQREQKKRRKIGKQDDVNMRFTSDDEEREVDEAITEYVGVDLEEGEYDPVAHELSGGRGDKTVDAKVAERRTYWLSKAIAVGND